MYNTQTPIDIHCSKIVDWLVQRRHCKRDWGEKLASVRRKLKSALRDMPESEEIKELLVGSKLDYFKSKRIVELLKTTEADTKNIFGYYSSQRMKDWQDIVYCYERDYIYIAEVATDLIREVNYEIPGIRKAIGRLNRSKDDAEKEKTILLRKSQQFHSEYQKLAQSYGIEGVNIVEELLQQSCKLPDLMDQIVSMARDLKKYLVIYRDYARSTTKLDPSEFATTLEYLIDKGNTTVYELKRGEPPEKIEKQPAASIGGTSNQSEIELLTDEIDFGDDLPSSSESSSGFVHVAGSNNPCEETFVQLDPVCESVDGKVARGEDAKLILESRKYRNCFLNNLHELDAFFKYLPESATGGTSDIDAGDISYVTSQTRRIFERVSEEKNRVLFQMCDTSTFISGINDKFAIKLKQAEECNSKAQQIEDKVREIESQIRDAELQLKKSIVSSKQLQERVESSLSEMYNGRTINIMGCVG